MTSLVDTRNQIIKLTLILAIVGFIGLAFYDINFAISFLAGAAVSILYLWHLGDSVAKLNPEKKTVKSVLRLSLTLVLMVIVGQLLSLNIIFISLGFLCNHFAMLLLVLWQLVRHRENKSWN